MRIYISKFVYSSIDGLLKNHCDGRLGCFYFLAIVSVAIYMCIYIYICLSVYFQFICYISKSGTAGSYGNSMFDFLRNH